MRWPILLAATALISGGCVPFAVYDTPGVAGRVEDNLSGAPVSTARIMVSSLDKPALTASAVTDANGNFRVEEIKHQVWLPPLSIDPAYPDAAVTVSAAGYKSLQTTFYKLNETAEYKPGLTIHLERQ